MLHVKFPKKTGFLHEASRFMSDTLGYGVILEGREVACIIINALAAPSALQETSSLTNCLTAACSPPAAMRLRDGLFLETVPFSATCICNFFSIDAMSASLRVVFEKVLNEILLSAG